MKIEIHWPEDKNQYRCDVGISAPVTVKLFCQGWRAYD